jgi:SAM-dependent methyltransferase
MAVLDPIRDASSGLVCDMPSGGAYLADYLPPEMDYLAIDPATDFFVEWPKPLQRLLVEITKVPLADQSVDYVVSLAGLHHEPSLPNVFREMRRLLRPGGRLVFAHTTPWPYLAWNPARERVTQRLRRPYFGMRRFDDGDGEGTIDFQLPYGEWIRCFRRHGLVVDDLIELRAPKHATTSYDDFDARWARRWPAEQIWVTRKQ